MIKHQRSIIKFRQSLIFAVDEVVVASFKRDRLKYDVNCIVLSKAATEHATISARELFKNNLETYLEAIMVHSDESQSELDAATIKSTQLDAAHNLCRSVGDLWRSM